MLIKLTKTKYNTLRLILSIYLVTLHFTVSNLVFVIAVDHNNIFRIYLYLNIFFHILLYSYPISYPNFHAMVDSSLLPVLSQIFAHVCNCWKVC